jgi:uncharacterized protein (TIGR00730 family)
VLAQRGISMVYGGGKVGMMGCVADAALAAGGTVIGVIPHHLADKELAHAGASQMHRVDTMHERKHLMAELAEGFIILPGGIGTLEELFEVFTWLQLGLHSKPIGILNVAGYFDPLLTFLDSMVEADIEPLLKRMATFEAPQLGKWWPEKSSHKVHIEREENLDS